jgi:D-lactate dehydrogenase
MARIAVFEIRPWQAEYLKKQLKRHTVYFFRQPLTSDNAAKAKSCDIISVFIYSAVSKEVIRKLPKLKLITTRSTGFDHIDLKECRNKKISVSNVPFYGENTVAEHTFALMLSLSRNVHKSYVRTLRDDYSIEGLTGFDLKNKTIGIVGGGHIGLHVARTARAFGMHVRVFDINRNEFLAEVINFKYIDLDELLKVSDIVTLHLPYNKYTHHLIDSSRIKLMKKGAVLINTARGGIVDTDALLKALRSGKLGGAGLDVIEGEELIKEEHELLHSTKNPELLRTIIRDREILHMDNVVFTPHNAFNSEEALCRILDTTVENIHSFIGNNLVNIVR